MIRKTIPALLATLTVFVATSAHAEDGEPDDSGIKLAPSIERAAGFSVATVKPDGGSSSSASFVTIGGVLHNPMSMPRAAFDVYLPSGLGFGASLGYGTVSTNEQNSQGQNVSGGSLSAYLLSPRVSYRVPISPFFDLVPRLGVTFLGATLTDGDSQSCTVGTGGATNCSTVGGSKDSVSAVALSPEILAVIRPTLSFNFIAGLSYDQMLSASSTSTSGGSGQSTSSDVKGSYSSVSLWFGIGGYL
jgi:hypothetical protein